MGKTDKLVWSISYLIRLGIQYIYHMPKHLIKLIIHPTSVLGKSYFPELKEHSKKFIIFSQLKNIIKYGDVDEYFYMYGLNQKKYNSQKDYVTYSKFMFRRDYLNLSNPHNSSCILRDKLYFGYICRGIGISTPQVEVLVLKNRPKLYIYDLNKELTINEFIQYYTGVLFCKPLGGQCGEGIFHLQINNKKIFIDGKAATKEELQEKLVDKDYIFQQVIQQHPLMNRLYKEAINTLRIVTVRNIKSGIIEVLPSILRIGANGSKVDNTSQGGIFVEVDNITGQLDSIGFYKPEYGLTTSIHPNSHIIFSEFIVPYMQQAIEQCKYFHSLLNLHSIGWDIAIGTNGPIFIEGNDNWEINGHQNYSHGLKKDFKRLFF